MDLFSGVKRDEEKCIGCGACQAACGFTHPASEDATLSNVIAGKLAGEPIFSVCRHCQSPDCALVCPTGAINKDPNGIVRVDQDKCVGCGICSAFCSHGGMRLEQSGASKCDLCDGFPSCVSFCPEGALEYHGQSSMTALWKQSEDLISPGISSCLGCTAELGLRFALRILGKNTVLAIPPGCMGGVGVVGYGMTTGAKVPVFFPLLDNVASMLSGIKREYQSKNRDVHVVAFAGDGGTADVGFQCLSAAAERGENIIYICYDNEGYMNTGFQRSGTTPYGAWTSTTPVGKRGSGKKQKSKNLALIMAAHEIPYVATASMSYPHDFERKLRKAMAVRDGLAYIHLFTPCPTGWRFPSDKGIEIGRSAVETNFFPLWEMERGQYRFTLEFKKPKHIIELLKKMGKYQHLSKGKIKEISDIVGKRYETIKSLVNQTSPPGKQDNA